MSESKEKLKETKKQKKQKEEKEYREVFKMFATSEGEKFGAQELGEVMRSYGMETDELELHDMISEIDTNGNGTIDFKEFMAVFEKKMKDSEAEEELRQAFKVFDKDGNGFLSSEELRHAMTQMGEKLTNEEVDEMIEEADMDKDGQINVEEFITIMTSTTK
jgi:calmodulin